MARLLGCLATLLGRYDDAERHFTAALDYCERLEAGFWTALTLLDHAELCAARSAPGDAERARELAARARDFAEDLGNAALVARADAVLIPA